MATDNQKKNAAQRALRKAQVCPGYYKHYKGSIYIVFATSIDEGTFEPLVHYYSIEHKTKWTRTLKNFTETGIRYKGEPYNRFKFIKRVSKSLVAEVLFEQ